MTSIADVSDRTIAELVSLSGRSAVVTGGAQGLGKGIARRLAEAGANVLIGDVNAEVAARAAADLDGRSSGSVLTANMDVSDSASVVAAAQLADAEFGGIDIWVNNAGIFPSVGLTEMSAEQWDKVFAVNARGLSRVPGSGAGYEGARSGRCHRQCGLACGSWRHCGGACGLREFKACRRWHYAAAGAGVRAPTHPRARRGAELHGYRR